MQVPDRRYPLRPAHWPRDTEHVVVLSASSNLSRRLVAEWATQALTDGYDSATLRQLAGCDLGEGDAYSSIASDVARVFAELGIEETDPELVGRWYVDWEANRIADGSIDGQQAVDAIHRRVVSPLGHPEDLSGWCLLWEGNHPTAFRPLDAGEWPRVIREFAAAWLARRLPL